MWPFTSSVDFIGMDFRTDVHSHILPGMDDGFRTEALSLQALDLLAQAGVRQVILTPHIYPELYPDNTPENIRHAAEAFNAAAARTGIICRTAGEHMVFPGIEAMFRKDAPGMVLSMPGSHVLIEMSYAYESPGIRDFIFHLNVSGYHPVLAHPERYTFYQDVTEEMETFISMDTALQLNVLSLGGFYGKTAKAKAEHMLEKGLYTYLGTDLHSLRQIDQLKSLRIKKNHVKAVERLLENNDALWNS